MPRDFANIAAHSPAATIDSALEAGAAIERGQRRQDYATFKRLAARFFDAPPLEANHLKMKMRNGFYLAMNGRGSDTQISDPATGERTVEVFYGKRPLRNFHHLSEPRLQKEWREVEETGAAMLYSQGDDGVVTVTLHPSFTSNMKPVEDAILLARYSRTEALTGRGALESHWRAFRAYAEVTSLEGEPSLADRLRVAWLRQTRPVLRGGRIQHVGSEVGMRQAMAYGVGVILGAWALSGLA